MLLSVCSGVCTCVQSLVSGEYIDEESDPAILRKRDFVYKEIVATEKDYIANLKIILDVSGNAVSL